MTNMGPAQDEVTAYVTSNIDKGLDLQPFLYQLTEIDKISKQIAKTREQEVKQQQASRSDRMAQLGLHLNDMGNFASHQVVQQQRPIGFSSSNEMSSSLYNMENHNYNNNINNTSKRFDQVIFPVRSSIGNEQSADFQELSRTQQWGTESNNNYNGINSISSLGHNNFDMMFNNGNSSDQNLTGGFTKGERKDIWSF